MLQPAHHTMGFHIELWRWVKAELSLKEEDFEIREIQARSLCTHGLYSPSPGNECMQPAEFNSLLVYYYLKISFCIPFYRGFTFQQNIQKIHTIEKKKR